MIVVEERRGFLEKNVRDAAFQTLDHATPPTSPIASSASDSQWQRRNPRHPRLTTPSSPKKSSR